MFSDDKKIISSSFILYKILIDLLENKEKRINSREDAEKKIR